MNRPNFQAFRVQLAAYAQSVGSPLGMCVGNIPGLAGLVNVATERLIGDPLAPEEGWWGGWAKYLFNVDPVINPFIVAPRGVARMIVLDVNTCPVKLQNGFYEFLDYGTGLQPKPCNTQTVCNGFTQAYDREIVPTLGVLASTPQIISVFPTDPRDAGKTAIVQGTDPNGKTVTSTDPVTNQTILGELVTLNFPFVNTVNQFLAAPNLPGITGLQKDATFGPVTFFQTDPVTGVTSQLSSMEPSETTSAYRKYFLNNIPCRPQCSVTSTTSQVVAMCKLDYIPIASDSDYLGILSVPALIAECEAIRMETMDSVKGQQMATAKHAKALQLLFGQLNHVLGNERPAVSVSLFGPRRHLRHQPI